MLVFSLNLEDVEEICSSGVDFDEVFVGAWGGCWDFGGFEVEGALYLSKGDLFISLALMLFKGSANRDPISCNFS